MKDQRIVIIGAGSTGLSIALEIAKSCSANITVLEKNYVGSGQTGHCCGLVRNFYNTEEMVVSAHYSMKKIQEMCRENPELNYEKRGLMVIDQFKNKKQIKDNVMLLNSNGVRCKYLENEQINSICPYLNAKSSCAGYDEEAGFINPQQVVDYLKNQCEKMGVKILENTKADAIKVDGLGYVVKSDKKQFRTDKLINATAGYTNNINAMLGIKLPVKTIRINNAFYRLPAGPDQNMCAIADFKNCFYVIPHRDFIDVSAMTLDLGKTINLEKEKVRFDESVIKHYLSLISKRINGAQKASELGGFGSNIDITPDYYPILSAIDELPNYYCATGFSGTGFKHFPMVGLLMKEVVLGEEYSYPQLVKFFRYDRFQSRDRRRNVRDSYFVSEYEPLG